MKKKVLGMVLGSTMLVSLLAGCSGSNENSQQGTTEPKASASASVAPAPTNGEKTTINFWHSMGGKNGEYIDSMIKSFNESQSNIEVVGTFQGGYEENLTKLQQAIPAKTAPDISMVERGFVPLLAEAEVLEDFYPYLEKSGMSESEFLPGLLGNVKFDNQLLALPFNRSTPLMHVNKTMLDEMNLAIPTTWEELDKVANALVIKEGSEYKRHGYSMPFASWYPIAMTVQSGGKFFNDEGTSIGFDMDTGVKVFDFLKKMQGTGALYYPPSKDSGNIVNQMFASGMIGLMFESTGVIGRHAGVVDFEYVTAFLPKNNNYGAPTGGANLTMLSGSKNKDAAWEFIKWIITDEQGGAKFILDSGYVPFTYKMVESAGMQAQWAEQPQRKVAFDQLEHAIDTNNHAQFAAVDQEFFKVMEAIMYDNEDIKTNLEKFKKETERLLEE